MKVTTLRLPEAMYDDLVEEAEEEKYSLSEYVRILLRNRQPHTAPNTNTQANTDERIDALEQRVAELEAEVNSGESLNQQTPAEPPDVLVKDDRGPEPVELGPEDVVDVDADPHGQTVKDALQWAIDNEPFQRADLIEAFEDDVDIAGESLWTRHVRDRIKKLGFNHDRSGGIATWQR